MSNGTRTARRCSSGRRDMGKLLDAPIADLREALRLTKRARVQLGTMPFSGAYGDEVIVLLQQAIDRLVYLVGDAT